MSVLGGCQIGSRLCQSTLVMFYVTIGVDSGRLTIARLGIFFRARHQNRGYFHGSMLFE